MNWTLKKYRVTKPALNSHEPDYVIEFNQNIYSENRK